MHFHSARYLCKGTRIEKYKSSEPEVSEPKETKAEKERKPARSYYCVWCEMRYSDAGQLQDHFTGVDHARVMTRGSSGGVCSTYLFLILLLRRTIEGS